ncbi:MULTISPECIES: heme-binding domain-containing protein [unclassified Cellulophaga]|uniref:heme-binding domain-containing protein n=1 Tax=unclassified Cellulophaga TaxID=2634405 RepID=UPI0026E27E9C|nr:MULTISPECIES: heme-binding domain-containing protein [unclassified Cellulophaga]MDO6492136.1 heme-binding domain-containing protein [Cellulophaga sp. 2_MG-2023]MDO6495703.1 heme-binding domain-containing protein [Cellulophaga sp. 3_MG-2023]
MKLLKKIILALLVILIAMQFYRPEKNSSETDLKTAFLTETNPSKEVQKILATSCYDCHSNTTAYPWYNNIAPVSYWLSDHVKDGKKHLNFSEWENYSIKKKDHKLDEVLETVESGEMPLKEYTWTHTEANLTEAQKQALINWVKNTRALYQLKLKQE